MRGKGIASDVPAVSAVDHPRLCGEKVITFVSGNLPLGSPPPMRGKERLFCGGCLFEGITPAYAGKSLTLAGSSGCCWDHPRLCGEKVQSTSDDAAKLGSPPPMRGKVCTTPPMLVVYRITPAYAGKSRFNRRYGK